MDDKRINTLAEFANVFANTGVERFMDMMILYMRDIDEDCSGAYPFPLTDKSWIRSLIDCYLQSLDTGAGDVSPQNVFRSGIKRYQASCRKENPEMYFLVENLFETFADENAQ